MSTIRGHMGEFRILENGNIKNIINVTKVSVKMDNSMMRSHFVGSSVPLGDQAIEGWSGSAAMEVDSDEVEQFIDALVSANLAGIGVADYAFVVTENYPDGSSVSYMYGDVQWAYSRENGGMNEKITKTLEFQASYRTRL